jgi:hypothetical protein
MGSTDRPRPSRFFCVGKTPLFEAARTGKHLREGRVNDRKSQVFLFPRVRWALATQDLAYDLDDAKAIPIRFRSCFHALKGRIPDATPPSWT